MAKKKKIGRPKLPKGQRQAAVVTVRMSASERRVIGKAAAAHQQKLSEWIRTTLLAVAEADTVKPEGSEAGGVEPPRRVTGAP